MNFFKKFNSLDFKNKDSNKKMISLSITIIGIILIITGTSAAYLMNQKEGGKNTINAGTLVLTLNSNTTGVSLSNALPISDEEGIQKEEGYTFSLENKGGLDLKYYIYLKNNCSTESSITINGNTITPDVCIPNEYIKVGIKKDDNDYQILTINESDELVVDGYVATGETINFTMKIWLDSTTPNDYNSIVDGVSRNVVYYGVMELKGAQITSSEIAIEQDESMANVPKLASNMIPVYYDETSDVWKKADNSNKNLTWFNYSDKMWANAVTVTEDNRSDYLNAEVGEEILIDDINTMWVWIPRFIATGEYDTYNGTNDINSPGAFDVTFVNKEEEAHDAFTFGSEELDGFWIAKFELSHELISEVEGENTLGCTEDGCDYGDVKILPNQTILRYNDVSNFFYAIRNMENDNNIYGFNSSEIDTHMIKNSEWGAVSYLTQSIYGRCTSSTNCNKIGTNNNDLYITGYGSYASSNVVDTSGENGTYETLLGQDATTTGNIYGVYDLSGGTYEYVMGVYTDGVNLWSGDTDASSGFSNSNSGFNGCLGTSCGDIKTDGFSFPESKYYNAYTQSDINATILTQHALYETASWSGAHYEDFLANEVQPWFIRGGSYSDLDFSIFSVSYFYGCTSDFSTRAILVK